MDERLLRRVQASGAIMVGFAYFLPWASIMSPLGSVELRGLYVDYAWILLVLAILHLLLQFARLNRDALGLSDSSLRYMEVAWRILPFVFVAFFAWYGASFGFNAHNASPGKHVIVFNSPHPRPLGSVPKLTWDGLTDTIHRIPEPHPLPSAPRPRPCPSRFPSRSSKIVFHFGRFKGVTSIRFREFEKLRIIPEDLKRKPAQKEAGSAEPLSQSGTD